MTNHSYGQETGLPCSLQDRASNAKLLNVRAGPHPECPSLGLQRVRLSESSGRVALDLLHRPSRQSVEQCLRDEQCYH